MITHDNDSCQQRNNTHRRHREPVVLRQQAPENPAARAEPNQGGKPGKMAMALKAWFGGLEVIQRPRENHVIVSNGIVLLFNRTVSLLSGE